MTTPFTSAWIVFEKNYSPEALKTHRVTQRSPKPRAQAARLTVCTCSDCGQRSDVHFTGQAEVTAPSPCPEGWADTGGAVSGRVTRAAISAHRERQQLSLTLPSQSQTAAPTIGAASIWCRPFKGAPRASSQRFTCWWHWCVKLTYRSQDVPSLAFCL